MRLVARGLRHAVDGSRLRHLRRRPRRGAERRAERADRGLDGVLRLRLRRLLGADAGAHLPRCLRGLVARAHMHKYGTTEAQMAAGGRQNHKHGVLNPKAQFRKEITLDTVLKSPNGRRSAEALRLLSFTRTGGPPWCSSPRRSRRKYPPADLGCSASAAASDSMLLGDKRDLSRVPATERAAATAYRQAASARKTSTSSSCTTASPSPRSWPPRGFGLFEPGAAAFAAEKGWTSPWWQ